MWRRCERPSGLFSFENDIGERGKLTGQMAVQKPHNSKPASQHRRRQSTAHCLLARSEPREPLIIGRKRICLN